MRVESDFAIAASQCLVLRKREQPLNVGLDAAVPALKLPAIGRLGLDR
jgi:hypothetical protein